LVCKYMYHLATLDTTQVFSVKKFLQTWKTKARDLSPYFDLFVSTQRSVSQKQFHLGMNFCSREQNFRSQEPILWSLNAQVPTVLE
jgi:hypothetical protein